MGPLFLYWKRHRIGGVFLASVKQYPHHRIDCIHAVKRYKALFILDVTTSTANIGTASYGAGISVMLVDGYTPKGPLVVWRAHTIQMTWGQWHRQVKAMWRITTHTGARSKTTTISTTTTTVSPTAS